MLLQNMKHWAINLSETLILDYINKLTDIFFFSILCNKTKTAIVNLFFARY